VYNDEKSPSKHHEWYRRQVTAGPADRLGSHCARVSRIRQSWLWAPRRTRPPCRLGQRKPACRSPLARYPTWHWMESLQ